MKNGKRSTPAAESVKRIALLMGQDLGYCRGVFRGIHTYALHKKRWVLRDVPPDEQILPSLREWQPQGIIAHLFDAEFARRVLALRKPLINIANTLVRLRAPSVEVDLEEIQRVRVERAKHLLAETDLPMPVIAARSGFSTPQRLAAVFRRATGQSPLMYRRQVRLRP